MKRYNIYIILSLLLLTYSCVKDDTLNEFKPLNEVSIEGLNDFYSVLLYNNLVINPELSTLENDDSDLSYSWYIYTINTHYNPITLSTEKNLNVTITPQEATPGLPYTLVFKVTDNRTGVFYKKMMNLDVTSMFTRGTILLCEENGLAEVNFIPRDESHTLLENVYAKANNGELVGTNPKKIYSLNPNAFNQAMKYTMILCNDENGGVTASTVSFEKEFSIRDLLGFVPDDIIDPTAYIASGFIDYLLINGNLSKRSVNVGGLSWETPNVVVESPLTYDLDPYPVHLSIEPVFYDRENSRLLKHYTWNKGSMVTFLDQYADNSVFDCNNMGDNLECVSAGELTGNNEYWMLMKNTLSGKYIVYKFYTDKIYPIPNNFSVVYPDFKSIAKVEIDPAIAPNIENAISFSQNESLKDIVMYNTADKVYSLNLSKVTDGSSILAEAEQINLSSDNMDITGVRFVTVTVPAPTTQDPNAVEEINQLRLFVQDHNQTGLKGGVIFYNVTTEGGIHSEKVFTKIGFCDKVIDIAEKES